MGLWKKSNNVNWSISQPKITEIIEHDELIGMLNWPELASHSEKTNGFSELLRLVLLFHEKQKTVENYSDCWLILAIKHFDQLLRHGYENFKRTIGCNYFNFLVRKGDVQIRAIESLFPQSILDSCRSAAQAIPHDPYLPSDDQFSYNYFVLLLWEYIKKIDTHNCLEKIQEPVEGNPILVHANGKSMSQDLANSLIEYYSIDQAAKFCHMKKILEIGGGYGRNAHVILSLNPHATVVLVDILPALYIAQRYLSSIFPDRKIFKVKSFNSYKKVKDELEAASIVFLMPHQISLLPEGYFDLCMNVSSFGEMTLEQVNWYFNQIHRLTKGHFYLKQWQSYKNPFDNIVLEKKHYPYRETICVIVYVMLD